jgi:site-specific DNA-methyltransferase (cytosine-N4-specific)
MIKEKLIFDFNGVDTSYLTHSIHPYPAKFPPQLPQTILKQFSKKGETVLDPFCGSGTTLVEARLNGINAIGVDVNSLFCLLSKVKTTPLNANQIKIIDNFIEIIRNKSFNCKIGNKRKIKIKEFEGITHWFQLNVAEEITFILSEIEKLNDNDIKDFLKIVLSSIIVRVSNQESDVRFAAINKNIEDCYTFDLFVDQTKKCTGRIIEYSNLLKYKTKVKVYNADSRNLSFLKPQTIDLIITSPPYANTYDYYLYHKLRQKWLGLDVQFAQYNEIGSRREYSSLKKNPQKWNDDLRKCFVEMNRILKNKGLAFIIIGDSVIKKELIKTDEIIGGFSYSTGFLILDIISSNLVYHSKIFNPSFAQKGKKEHLIILQKNDDRN